MYFFVLWVGMLAALVVQQVWTFRGRESPHFFWIEVALCSLSALLWALLAASTRCNKTLLVFAVLWDVAYTLIAVGVPWWLGVEVRMSTWLFVTLIVVGAVGVTVTMEGQP